MAISVKKKCLFLFHITNHSSQFTIKNLYFKNNSYICKFEKNYL